MVATITAIFTLREDMENTLKYGKHRIFGNVLGAVMSMVVILIFSYFGQTDLVQLICIPLIIMLQIAILAHAGYQEGTVGACATLLTIVFMIPSDHSYAYAFGRVIDSFIGMGIALLVNYAIPFKYNKRNDQIKQSSMNEKGMNALNTEK